MINIKNTNDRLVKVDMSSYGMKMEIDFDYDYLQYVIKFFEVYDKEAQFINGNTIKEIYYKMYDCIHKEDNYFYEKKERMITEKIEWDSYIDACILYIVLANKIENKNITLIYEKEDFDAIPLKTPSEMIRLPHYIWAA